MSRLARWCRQESYPAFAGAVVAGALLSVTHGYAPELAPVAPIPLLLGIRLSPPRRCFYLGLICGVLEAAILAGIAIAGWTLALGLALDYALFRAGFAVVLGASRARGLAFVFAAPALWSLLEWLHCQVPLGLPNLLGDTQHLGFLLPLARMGGTYLISFFLVWGAAVLAEWLLQRLRPSAVPVTSMLEVALAAALGTVALTAMLAGARWVLPSSSRSIRAVAVQGGLPTWVYEREESTPAWEGASERVYAMLTARAPASDLLVWPETSVLRTWGEDERFAERMRARRRSHGGAFLVGVSRREGPGRYFNSAVFLAGGGREAFANKRRLVVHAEQHFSPGIGPQLLSWGPTTLGVIFCLESVVPDYGRELVRAGAELLVVLAEGGRFGRTPVGRLHAQRSIVRAVEMGRSIVHAGQQGYSMLITPAGQSLGMQPPYVAANAFGTIPLATGQTPFVRYGAWIVGIDMLVLAWVGVGRVARRRNSKQAKATA